MIILASTSPTRQAILRAAGLAFTSIASEVNEQELILQNPQWTVSETASKLAEAKAIRVSEHNRDAFVIGADQVLALGNTVLTKPAGVEQCRQQLLQLRGKTHALISSVVCARNGKREWSHMEEALLSMRPFSESFLNQYLDSVGEDCTSSVGGYKIEELGIQLFNDIRGDHYVILGLPLIPLLDYLRKVEEVLS